ncbi:beta-lactamase hydrolase domain-containing protein [Anabaena sp. UHCC 0204]|uniref:fused DSP-PTPase phosphatase/NAD kinase-like protein n=1 Tax=Anabaena sp. UHCC 0204 TaxID=2590009 RepID=UPI00144880A3|nr:sulfur transferase domain-containing protein [Anabaena sp. UHCC 0204]MTJ10419.1 hypothetical protein [Anabaena sp. UHCC 0204]
MEIVRKITQELAIVGQVTPEQLHDIANDGYKSILNLRFADEKDWWEDEQKQTEDLGLNYVNIPIKFEELNPQISLEIFAVINQLPKPILIHCDNAIRSAAIVLLYIANKQGIEFDQVWEQNPKLFWF